jgi:hypothetical protein
MFNVLFLMSSLLHHTVQCEIPPTLWSDLDMKYRLQHISISALCKRVKRRPTTTVHTRHQPPPHHAAQYSTHTTHPTPAPNTSRSTGRWINTLQCHHPNVPHNTNRQSSKPSEHQILWFYAIPSLVVTGILITTFNQDFLITYIDIKYSDQCSIL